jgi:hypothetical protein
MDTGTTLAVQGRMSRSSWLTALLACGCASGVSCSDAATAGSFVGRVQITQESTSIEPTVSTNATFGRLEPCVASPSGSVCTCVDDTFSGCARRTCDGHVGTNGALTLDELLDYDGILRDRVTGGFDAGTLRIQNGGATFEHGTPYDQDVDALTMPWQPGDSVTVAGLGGQVPPFSAVVPFPSRVTFLDPDLQVSSVSLASDSLTLHWTPVQGSGTVEVVAAWLFAPDASTDSVVVRCAAPVDAGTLTVPVPPTSPQPLEQRGVAVRVVNRAKVDVAGLSADVLVASFDSGRLNEALPPPDGGAPDGP